MDLIFRKLDENNPSDVRQFCELMDDLTTRANDQTVLLEKIRKVNANEDAYMMVAEDAATGKLCGTLLAITFGDFCDTCRPIMIIENVVTHHDYQRMGIGRRMFEEIEAWGKQKDVCYAILCSSMSREGAHRFYHSIGYDEVKGFKKYL